MKVITFGTFDLFHIGHLKILQRANAMGTHLTVGISSDTFNLRKKNKLSIIPQADRIEIVSNIVGVDTVFVEESMELKRQYLIDHQADILVMGDDWKGRFDEFQDLCKVVYLKRTEDVSTSYLLDYIISGPTRCIQ